MIISKIKELNQKAAASNAASASSNGGAKKTSFSEKEYCGLKGKLSQYGVDIEGPGKHGDFKNVLSNVNAGLNSGCMISVTNAKGEEEQVELNQAIADSYDSVLDMVLKQKLEKVLGTGSWKIENLKTPQVQAKLKKAGIEFKVLDHRIYTFSLIDDEGNVIQDENGKLGQIIMTDKVLPDGYMQGVDKNWNAILDAVGYNCVSELDFTAEEWNQIKQLAELDNSQLGSSSGKKTTDIYKNAKVVVAGKFGGKGGGSTPEDAAALLAEEASLFAFEEEEMLKDKLEAQKILETKAEKEKEEIEKEEDQAGKKDGRISVSKAKYNKMLEQKVQTLAQEYEDQTGLEATSFKINIFKKDAREELDKKYVAA